MDNKYSSQYNDLYADIKKSSNANMDKSIIKRISDKVKNNQVYIAIGLIFLALICIISIIVCLFTSWKIVLIGSIIGLIMSVLLFFLSIYFTVVIDAVAQLKQADKYMREQKFPCHYAVAGYYYYEAKNNSRTAKKRWEKLLKTPEFLEYFSVNGLAYDERIEFRGLSEFEIHLKYFRKYVTEYYGARLKKTDDFELFHKTNLKMYSSQIRNYDALTQHKPIEDSSLYSKASKYYLSWCGGDIESRERLKEIYLKEEVWNEYCEYMKGVGEYCKKNNMPITHISLKNKGFNMFLSTAHNWFNKI